MPSSTSSSDRARRFLVAAVLLFAVGLSAVAVFNWIVNPLMYFRGPQISSLSAYKTEPVPYLHLIKPQWLAESEANTVILGSSTAAIGLDPEHPTLAQAAFNYGMPGARMRVLADLYSDAASRKAPERVILALDFFSFNALPALVEIRDNELRRRLAPGDNAAYQRWRDRAAGLLSLRSLALSVETIRKQQAIRSGRAGFFEFERNGHWRQTLAPGLGQRQHFRNIERQYMSSGWFPAPEQRFGFEYQGYSSLDEFRRLLRRLHNDDVQVEIVLPPLHARFQLALAEVDLDDEFRDWKRQLVHINEEVAVSLAKPAFSLWDFSDASDMNREIIPQANDSNLRMTYFMDGHHYLPALGDELLSRISASSESEEAEFGRLLNSANIEDHLAAVTQALADYASNNRQEMEGLRRNRASIQ